LRTERHILTNTAVLGIGEGVGQIAGFVFVVLCARAYGPSVLGWYSLAVAMGALAAVFVRLGTHGRLLRDLAADPSPSKERVGAALPYELAFATLGWLALVGAFAAFTDDRVALFVVATVCAFHILASPINLLLIPFRARQIMWPAALMSAGQRSLVVLAAVPLILLDERPELVFAAFPAATLVTGICVFVAANRFLDGGLLRLAPWAEMRAMYASALPFFGIAVVNVLYIRLALLLIGAIGGEDAAGIYGAADRLGLLLGVGQALFLSALGPAIVQLAAKDRERALEVANRCMRLLLLITVPLAGAIAIFQHEIVAIVFGAEFEQSGAVLAVIAAALVVKGTGGVWSAQATAIGLQSSMLRIRVIAIAAFTVAAFVVIPTAGPLGLATCLLLADLGSAVALRAQLSRHRFAARVGSAGWKPAVAVAAAVLAYAALADASLAVRAVVVAAAMLAVLVASGAVRPHDLRFLRAMMK